MKHWGKPPEARERNHLCRLDPVKPGDTERLLKTTGPDLYNGQWPLGYCGAVRPLHFYRRTL